MNISWHEETRLISELKPYSKNPREISKKNFDHLLKSIKECGYNNRLLINLDNTIAAGHQRLKALEKLGVQEIPVLVPERLLTEDEFKQVLITDNVEMGKWDFDILANDFEIDDLIDWGMAPELFDIAIEAEEEEQEEKQKDKLPCKDCPMQTA